jgi:hypothetical protein
MKYFEIVFDNSASMGKDLAGSTRIKVAKDLFLNDILPNVDQNTLLAVRLLRHECSGTSTYNFFGANVNDCVSFILGIQPIGRHTPLYNTMKDALHTTSSQQASEKTIFVLTDGGDNCGLSVDQVLTVEERKWFRQINVILAQFTVSEGTEVNQISHFANSIGARTFRFGSNPNMDAAAIRSELKVELQKAGLTGKGKLNPCFENLSGDSIQWAQIEAMGFNLHQAVVLYQEDCLSWMPKYSENVSPTQFAELKFLYGIRFTSGISSAVMKAMLDQLQKPYYYSSNCIYWHFEEARWKYFPQPAPIVIEKEVEKIVEREVEKLVYVDRPYDADRNRNQVYREGSCYEVRAPKDFYSKTDSLDSNRHESNEFILWEIDNDKNAKLLKRGDKVRFTSRLRGRPKKR